MNTPIVRGFAVAVALLIFLAVATAGYRYITTKSSTALQNVTLCAIPRANESELTGAKGVIQGRLDALRLSHSQVTTAGGQCLSVGIQRSATRLALSALLPPGVVAITDGGSTSLSTGRRVKLVCPPALRRCAPNTPVGATKITARPPVLQVVVPDSEIQHGSASLAFDQEGNPTVNYSLTPAGAERWCRFTTSHVGIYAAIVLDNKVLIDPTIEAAICSAQTQITLGQGATTDEAKRIASYLSSGSYPGGIHFRVKR